MGDFTRSYAGCKPSSRDFVIPLFRGLEGTAKLERGKFLRDITEELLLLTVLLSRVVAGTQRALNY